MSRLALAANPQDHTGSPGGKGHGTASESELEEGPDNDSLRLIPTADAFVKRARTTAMPVIDGGAYEKRVADVTGVEETATEEPAPAGRMSNCTGRNWPVPYGGSAKEMLIEPSGFRAAAIAAADAGTAGVMICRDRIRMLYKISISGKH